MLDEYGGYRFRAIAAADAAFVRQLFHATLRSQMPLELTGLSEQGIVALLDQQLGAQTEHYSSNYPHAEISIVEHPDDGPVARLIVIEFDDEVRLGDLMVVHHHRKRGLCSYIMDCHVDLGLATGRCIRLHVEKANPAVSLYRRKHFEVVSDLNSHWLMEYQVAGTVNAGTVARPQLNTAS
jgi:hypothetical protein